MESLSWDWKWRTSDFSKAAFSGQVLMSRNPSYTSFNPNMCVLVHLSPNPDQITT